MIWDRGAWDELDEILLEPTDSPKPEGGITEIDLDMINREDMEDE